MKPWVPLAAAAAVAALFLASSRKVPRTYKLTAGAESWVWEVSELPDTLYESEHWEEMRIPVGAMAVGDELVVAGETLRRLT